MTRDMPLAAHGASGTLLVLARVVSACAPGRLTDPGKRTVTIAAASRAPAMPAKIEIFALVLCAACGTGARADSYLVDHADSVETGGYGEARGYDWYAGT